MIRQFTLDSNIIIKSSIRENNCLDIVSFFLKNFNLNDSNYFLSPQVKRELSDIQPRISMLLLFLKNYIGSNKSVKEGYNEFLNNFKDEKNKKEFSRFSNIIDYLDEKTVSETDIENFSNAIVHELGAFITRDMLIKPTEDMCRVNSKVLNNYRKYLRKKYIVKDTEDIWLIAQLMYLVSSEKQEINFTTDNLKDFDYGGKDWVNNDYLKKIIVYSSKEFYNKFVKL